MGLFSTLTRVNTEKALNIIVLIEVLYWVISVAYSIVKYLSDISDQSVFHDIEARLGSRTKVREAQEEYKRLREEWKDATIWLATTGGVLIVIQMFLLCGVCKRNRCLIFCWILSCLVLGILRVIVVFRYEVVPSIVKYLELLWALRIFYIYLAIQYMLQITNEKIGQEEVEPPQFRPQSDDPREYREGLNYPVFPRSLEFADRVAGRNRQEHANPKRWEPTYDAFDTDGRMVVVLDDPFYESL